jgi:hypothetical protein
LLDVAVDSVTIDQTIDRKDLYSLVKRFKNLDPNAIETYSLPVIDHTTAGGAKVLYLQPAEAQPTLDIFRGIAPGTAHEGDVRVNVMNGSGNAGQARDVSAALTAVGFQVGPAGNAKVAPRTTIHYAPGGQTDADLVARHLTSSADLVVDPTLAMGTVELITGRDFTTVMQAARAPATSTPANDAAQPPDVTATTIVPPTTTTPAIGVTPETPAGVNC